MNTLIAYFSWSNNTKNLIEGINNDLKFDVVRIEREKPYSTDYHECAYVEAKEEIEKRINPNIKKIDVDYSKYDKVYLFFPIWWYTYPMPVETFLKELKDYKGEVILFANSFTNDPKYMENSLRDAKKANKELNIKEGLFNKSIKEHLYFINK